MLSPIRSFHLFSRKNSGNNEYLVKIEFGRTIFFHHLTENEFNVLPLLVGKIESRFLFRPFLGSHFMI